MLLQPKSLIKSSGFIITIAAGFFLFFWQVEQRNFNNNQSTSPNLIFEFEKIQSGFSYPFIHLSKEETLLQVNFTNKKRKLPYLLFTYAGRLLTSRNTLQNLIVKIENILTKKYSPPFDIIYHRLNI